MRDCRLVLLLAALLALDACTPRETNFSQVPGFAAHFARNPPRSAAASPADRALLARHAPRFMLPEGHPGLIGFYEDYVAQGRLIAADGSEIARNPTRTQLNAVRDDPRVEFVHEPAGPSATPVVLARIERATGPDGGARPWSFMTYSAVFRSSGLPAAMPWWESLVLGAIGDLEDWHQLDHYTAATVVLDPDERPVALAMQQHNGRRTYLVGRDVALPPDGRLVVDVAVRSNELYAHRPGRHVRRAVRLQDAAAMRYLVTGRSRPLMSTDDITDPRHEAAYRIDFLPPDDAFYVFKGFLGERRRLPGRSGPPGADYNIQPAAKGPVTEMLAGYWREGDAETLAAVASAAGDGVFALRFAEARRAAFLRDVDCVRRARSAC
ncbi:MAG: hypothetical protein JNK67_28945 [Alphaproteobacteria bacterium]|nr:hypothetical protein [Alphaproteobacteria bacterium]